MEGTNPVSSEREMSAKLVFDHFLKTTSAHGYFKLSKYITNVYRKLIWLVILLLACGTCMYHLYTFAEKFAAHSSSTKIKFGTRDDLYPSITICYNRPFFLKNASNPVPRYNNSVPFYVVDGLTSKFWTNNLQSLNISFTDFFAMYTRSIMPLATISEVLVIPRIPLIRCFMENRHNCLWSFNKSFVYENRPCVSGHISRNRVTNLKLITLWPYSRLSPKNNISFVSYDSFISVYLHGMGTYPSGLEHKALASQYSLNIYYKLLSHNLTCNDPRPDIQIISRLSNETLTFKYSKILCNKLNTQMNIWNTCKCISEILPIPLDLRGYIHGNIDYFCHSIWENLLNSSQSNLTRINERVTCHNKQMGNMSSECVDLCHYYDVSVTSQYSYLKPEPAIVNSFEGLLNNLSSPNNTNTLQRNFFNSENYFDEFGDMVLSYPYEAFLQINIDYSPEVLLYESKVSYDIMTFLSDIGGILGLYMGWSVLTVIEIFVFLAELVVSWYNPKLLQ